MSAGDELVAIADGALASLEHGEAEVVIAESRSELTRFAGNEIHQSVAERYRHIRVRLIDGGRIGVGAVRGHGERAMALAFAAAEESRRVTTSPDVSPLPAPTQDHGNHPAAFSEATAAATPQQRAELVSIITADARAHELDAYGALSTSTTTTAIVTSAGLRRTATSTQASLVSVARGQDGGGYASRHSADIGALDVAGLAAEVVDTCERNQGATAIGPGEYEVILSPYAVMDLLEHLAWVGFSALAVQEHRSFMRIGEHLMSDSITIRDDAQTPDIFPFPFDDEGVSTRPVTLIDRGVCAGVVYDTPTALHDGVESTGHSLPQPNTWGPLPRHLAMDAGDTPWQEMVSSVSRGLYITRFWYVRDVHPLRTVITGMTREGTFLIEQGSITRPVKDLRFTQSIVDALADVVQVSRERRLELGEGESGVLSPWLHIGRFSFTS
ncbi:MAG TPA: metallopeptidase TldD-related protein [Candidatus Saccharimonadales bacterium]|nr:metallopeptidase TldD-related protein [Candidatus Saccharimonadales bacterium]